MNMRVKVNVISQHIVIKYQLTHMNISLPQSQFLNEQKTYCFSVYKIHY